MTTSVCRRLNIISVYTVQDWSIPCNDTVRPVMCEQSLKIPEGIFRIHRFKDQWPKEKEQTNKQTIYKTLHIKLHVLLLTLVLPPSYHWVESIEAIHILYPHHIRCLYQARSHVFMCWSINFFYGFPLNFGTVSILIFFSPHLILIFIPFTTWNGVFTFEWNR
jgi:hypothetical protein